MVRRGNRKLSDPRLQCPPGPDPATDGGARESRAGRAARRDPGGARCQGGGRPAGRSAEVGEVYWLRIVACLANDDGLIGQAIRSRGVKRRRAAAHQRPPLFVAGPRRLPRRALGAELCAGGPGRRGRRYRAGPAAARGHARAGPRQLRTAAITAARGAEQMNCELGGLGPDVILYSAGIHPAAQRATYACQYCDLPATILEFSTAVRGFNMKRPPLAASLPLTACLLLAGCRQAPPPEETPPAPVKAQGAVSATFGEWTELVGATQPLPDLIARITAPVEGHVVSVLTDENGKPVREGQRVEKNQLIVQLDERAVRAQIAELAET